MYVVLLVGHLHGSSLFGVWSDKKIDFIDELMGSPALKVSNL